MSRFRVIVTVHKDYVIEIEAASKMDAVDDVNENMCEYISGSPEDYLYSEITDVELM